MVVRRGWRAPWIGFPPSAAFSAARVPAFDEGIRAAQRTALHIGGHCSMDYAACDGFVLAENYVAVGPYRC
eukprot:12814115-Alexandrium_andersonii.AAC.1